MANQAAKKAKVAGNAMQQKLLNWILPINAVYLLYCVLWHYNTFDQYYGYLVLLFVTYFCYSTIVGAAKEGLSANEYFMDVLIITLATQVGLLITNKAWYLFALIPGFVMYKGGKMVVDYVFTQQEGEKEPDAAALKRAEKKERKAKRMHRR